MVSFKDNWNISWHVVTFTYFLKLVLTFCTNLILLMPEQPVMSSQGISVLYFIDKSHFFLNMLHGIQR